MRKVDVSLPPPLNSVELLRSLRIVLRVLPAHRQALGMPLTHITSNHPLVSNVLQHLTLKIRLEAYAKKWVTLVNS